MSYLIALPCMAAIYMMVGKLNLSRSGFAVLGLLLTVVFAQFKWFEPGFDALIAACLTMALANLCAWLIDALLMEEIPEDVLHSLQQEKQHAQRMRRFCSRLTHDFAVRPRDSVFAVDLVNGGNWAELAGTLNSMKPEERQGFYANLNYSAVSERALQEAINNNPHDADAHILMGHVKLCLAKRMGLQPGTALDEPVALAMQQSFRHFNLALRTNSTDPEALCGLLMAKGFTGLSAEHVMRSLRQLLEADPTHLHGVVAAARFLILSTSHANEFTALVESTVAGRSEVTVAIARIITHIECMDLVQNGVSNSKVIADLYVQLRNYKQATEALGSWQKGISENIIAYMLKLIGDKEGSSLYFEKISGSVSPYPWQSDART